jgi:hypothetical protein
VTEKKLYAIVLRLTAMRRGAVPFNHGDHARAALYQIIKQAI